MKVNQVSRRILMLSVLPVFIALLLVPARAQQVPVEEAFLSNGMKLLMVQRTNEPSIAGGWVVHVGSANERPGITGIAHLFEHMMFKGTPTLGTKDYQRDLEIIAEQERVRDLMREEERKMRQAWRRGKVDDPFSLDGRTERYKELEKRFNELITEQREILVKNEFDLVYTRQGGSGMNAFTSHDMTGYFINLPANKLELWAWMESERLLRPVFREFYAERDVVFEERRMRTEATPLGKFHEIFEAMFWTSHPYGWPVIGWPSDIPAISKADADEFYRVYYSPQNITLILIGDFHPAEATSLAERYFGRIPRGETTPPDVVTLELKPQAEKRMYAEAEANPQVDIAWHTVPFGHRDSYPLQVVAQLLSTRTGRLYKGLVLGSEVATEVYASQSSRKWAGGFNAGGESKEGRTPQEVEEGIYAEIEKLKEELVPDEELQKVKNNFAANEYRRLSSNFPILYHLLFNEGRGDWREINEAGPKIQAVTPEDIQRVAAQYFTKERRVVAVYTRKGGAPREGGELAGLTPEQQAVVRLIAGKLQEEKSLANLRAALKPLDDELQNADARNKPFLNLRRKLVQDRIEQLEKEKP